MASLANAGSCVTRPAAPSEFRSIVSELSRGLTETRFIRLRLAFELVLAVVLASSSDTLIREDSMDVNDDGEITTIDSQMILEYYSIGGDPPAAPFPAGGRFDSGQPRRTGGPARVLRVEGASPSQIPGLADR